MTDTKIAKEKLLAASLQLVSSRLNIDSSEPGPYDDAQRELCDDIFDQAVDIYVQSRDGEKS